MSYLDPIESRRQARDQWVNKGHQDESKSRHQAHNNKCLTEAFDAGVAEERKRAQAHAPRPCTCLYCNAGDGYNCIHGRAR